MKQIGCSEDPDVKGTETGKYALKNRSELSCSEDPDVKGTETKHSQGHSAARLVAARIPM